MSDVMKDAREIMDEITEEVIKKQPIWIRAGYLAAMAEQVGDDSKVDWKKINHHLNVGFKENEVRYNLYGYIDNLEDLGMLAAKSRAASIPELENPYYGRKCVSCNEDFTLTKKEIDFFQRKGLKIPCRCYECRKGIKKEKPVQNTVAEPEAPAKTAMQIAMEKAGLA